MFDAGPAKILSADAEDTARYGDPQGKVKIDGVRSTGARLLLQPRVERAETVKNKAGNHTSIIVPRIRR